MASPSEALGIVMLYFGSCPLPATSYNRGNIKGYIWECLKIEGTFLGVPIIRTIVFWGLYWGPLILGNYHITIT